MHANQSNKQGHVKNWSQSSHHTFLGASLHGHLRFFYLPYFINHHQPLGRLPGSHRWGHGILSPFSFKVTGPLQFPLRWTGLRWLWLTSAELLVGWCGLVGCRLRSLCICHRIQSDCYRVHCHQHHLAPGLTNVAGFWCRILLVITVGSSDIIWLIAGTSFMSPMGLTAFTKLPVNVPDKPINDFRRHCVDPGGQYFRCHMKTAAQPKLNRSPVIHQHLPRPHHQQHPHRLIICLVNDALRQNMRTGIVPLGKSIWLQQPQTIALWACRRKFERSSGSASMRFWIGTPQS